MAEIALQYVTLTWQMKNTFPHSTLEGREPEYNYLPSLGLDWVQQGQNVGLELPSPQGSHLLSAWLRPLGKGKGLMRPICGSWAPHVKILFQN